MNAYPVREYGPVEEYRERLVEENIHLVKIIAHQVSNNLPNHIDVNDLISAGTIGLLEAIERFDWSMNVKFNTYASKRIRGAMLDELRELDWMTRSMREKSKRLDRAYHAVESKTGMPAAIEEVAEHLDVSLDLLHKIVSEVKMSGTMNLEDLGKTNDGEEVNILDCIKDPEALDPLMAVRLNEVKRNIAETISELPENQKLIISLYYYDELTLREIGQVLKLTESRVCQLHKKAIERLKFRLEKLDLTYVA